MKALKILALVLVFVLTVPAMTVFIAGQMVNMTLLNEDFYGELLQEQQLARQLHLAVGQLADTLPEDLDPDVAELMSDALSDALDESFIEESLTAMTRDLLSYLRGDQPGLTAVIDLEGPLARFEASFDRGLAELPAERRQELTGPDGSMPELSGAYVIEQLDLPRQLALAELFADFTDEFASDVDRYQYYQGLMSFVPYVFFALMLALFLLLAGVGGGLKWFGWAALLGGTVTGGALAGARLALGYPRFALRYLMPLLEHLPVDPAWTLDAGSYMLGRLLVVPIWFAAGGLALIVVGSVVNRSRRQLERESGPRGLREPAGAAAAPADRPPAQPPVPAETDPDDPDAEQQQAAQEPDQGLPPRPSP